MPSRQSYDFRYCYLLLNKAKVSDSVLCFFILSSKIEMIYGVGDYQVKVAAIHLVSDS